MLGSIVDGDLHIGMRRERNLNFRGRSVNRRHRALTFHHRRSTPARGNNRHGVVQRENASRPRSPIFAEAVTERSARPDAPKSSKARSMPPAAQMSPAARAWCPQGRQHPCRTSRQEGLASNMLTQRARTPEARYEIPATSRIGFAPCRENSPPGPCKGKRRAACRHCRRRGKPGAVPSALRRNPHANARRPPNDARNASAQHSRCGKGQPRLRHRFRTQMPSVRSAPQARPRSWPKAPADAAGARPRMPALSPVASLQE